LDQPQNEIESLRAQVASLTSRVYRLEQALAGQPAAEAMREAEPESVKGAAPAPPVSPSIQPGERILSPLEKGPSRDQLPQGTPSRDTPYVESDLESRIGSHWLNRIGITAVLVGVSYFLKFAFDNNWIGAAGRVTIGLIAGMAVVIWSESFRRRGYQFFSYSLKAVGIGVLYLSLWAAFQLYHLVPSGVAFVAMLAVTAATAALALAQDAEILAAFALAGGFLTPVLLSTGENRELQLFSYVTILDAATLVLVTFKAWQRLLILSFAGTGLLYIGWYSEYYSDSQLRLTLGFATLFFAIFAVAPLVARPAHRQEATDKVSLIALFLALVNAGVYFLAVYAMYEETNKTATAWFALALAGVYIGLSRRAAPRYGEGAQQAIRLLHLGLAIAFITIAIPIRLDAHWITIGWLVEAGFLLWLGERIKSDLLNVFAVGALVLGVARLVVFDNFQTTTLIFNTRMMTYAVAIVVLGGVAWAGGKRDDGTGRTAAAAASIALNVLALIALSREVADFYSRQTAQATLSPIRWNSGDYARVRAIRLARDFTYSALWMAYGAMLMIVGFWRRSAFVRWQALALIAFTVGKVFIYDVSELDRGYRIVSFIVLGVLLLAISFVYQKDWLQLGKSRAGAAR
jgi:uncharacterized membrane protein